MRHKSITFRCSAQQLERMSAVLGEHGMNRSACLSEALHQFLEFADGQEAEGLDLFGLVEKVDSMGGPSFADQA